MVLPLNLAMTSSEIAAAAALPADLAWMACHFSSDGTGLDNLPTDLPEGSLLILDDSIPCRAHSAGQAAEILCGLISRFRCCGVLLDFQRPGNAQSAAVATALVDALPCSVAVTPEYAKDRTCPVFLPPAPLHVPLEKYLRPWSDREIWLEAALCQEQIVVTRKGTAFISQFPPDCISGGFYDDALHCRYQTQVNAERVKFTLYDTPDSLTKKLEFAQSLGVKRAVGLWQELRDL